MRPSLLLKKVYTCWLRWRSKRQLQLGKDVLIPWGSQIGSPVVIGDFTRINGRIIIKGRDLVTIGRYCAIGWDVRIISTNHSLNKPNLQESLHRQLDIQLPNEYQPISIGNNVWIGDLVTILPGVKIGDGAVIGAGAIVSHDIPPFAVAVGIPARVKKFRFTNDICRQLERISWWNWNREKILKNRTFFNLDLNKTHGDLIKFIE